MWDEEQLSWAAMMPIRARTRAVTLNLGASTYPLRSHVTMETPAVSRVNATGGIVYPGPVFSIVMTEIRVRRSRASRIPDVVFDAFGTCDDGDACTTVDLCENGLCTGTTPANCDDGNPCTDDSCDSEAGCLSVFNTSPCDDGSPCTEGDTCEEGGARDGQSL